jgi:hypothetical protein
MALGYGGNKSFKYSKKYKTYKSFKKIINIQKKLEKNKRML